MNERTERGRATCPECGKSWSSKFIAIGEPYELPRHHRPDGGGYCAAAYSYVTATDGKGDDDAATADGVAPEAAEEVIARLQLAVRRTVGESADVRFLHHLDHRWIGAALPVIVALCERGVRYDRLREIAEQAISFLATDEDPSTSPIRSSRIRSLREQLDALDAEARNG